MSDSVGVLNGGPVGPRILIKIIDDLVDSEDKKDDSLIIVPETAKRKATLNSTKGRVIAMGLDCYNEVFAENVGAVRPWCQVGDIVSVRSHASLCVSDSAEGYIIVNDQDVIHNFSNDSLCNKE